MQHLASADLSALEVEQYEERGQERLMILGIDGPKLQACVHKPFQRQPSLYLTRPADRRTAHAPERRLGGRSRRVCELRTDG